MNQKKMLIMVKDAVISRDDSTNLRIHTHNNLQPERLNLRGREVNDGWPVVGDDVKTTEEYLIRKLKRHFRHGYVPLTSPCSIFNILIGNPKLTSELGDLSRLCRDEFREIIERNLVKPGVMVDKRNGVDKDDLDLDKIDIEFICNLFEIIEDRAYEHLKKRDRIIDYANILLYRYILEERVVRVPPNGKVNIPRVQDPAIQVSDEEIEKNDFKGMVDFTKKMRDRELLEKTFNENFFDRFNKLGEWPDRDNPPDVIVEYREQLIDTIINEMEIDIVRGISGMGHGYAMGLHTRRGLHDDMQKGVWIGEYMLRALSEDEINPVVAKAGYKSNFDYFLIALLEEAQHFDTPYGTTHVRTKGTKEEKNTRHNWL